MAPCSSATRTAPGRRRCSTFASGACASTTTGSSPSTARRSHPLDALPGLEQRYDDATLTIELDLPPDQFEATELQAARPTNLGAVAGRGGFFEYDLLFVSGDELRTRLDSLLELGMFDQVGVLISGFRAGDVANDERVFVRLDTTFTRDFPERRASLRLGDSLTEGGALGRPVRFGGIQWSTDFSTDPTFVTFPLPTIGGLAEQPSVAEVFLNNIRRVTEQVPPGRSRSRTCRR